MNTNVRKDSGRKSSFFLERTLGFRSFLQPENSVKRSYRLIYDAFVELDTHDNGLDGPKHTRSSAIRVMAHLDNTQQIDEQS